MKKCKRKLSVKILYTITVICALATLAIYFYPDISDAWNRYVASKRVSEYISSTSDEKKDYTEMKEAAYAYNKALYEHGVNNINEYTFKLSGDESKPGEKISGEILHPDAEYESQIAIEGSKMMGVVEIPKIDVSIPIYHYTSEDVLSKGVGHLYGSSLPVGGSDTHSVLTGHSGLINAKYFTDLEKLKENDVFSIFVMGEKLNYQIDQIKTVLPKETDDLAIEEGKDLVTLITCTPYGINTHRLLVRGHRIADDEVPQEELTPMRQIQEVVNFPITIFIISGLVLLVGVIIIIKIWRKG